MLTALLARPQSVSGTGGFVHSTTITVPPPSKPTLLGAADTRNFSHCSLDESDAERVGVPLETVERADAIESSGEEEAAAAAEVGELHRSCWDDF